MRGAGPPDARKVLRLRARRSVHGAEGRSLDDRAYAGFYGLLLLPQIPVTYGEDPHASLGTGLHVSFHGTAIDQAWRPAEANCLLMKACGREVLIRGSLVRTGRLAGDKHVALPDPEAV